MQYYNNILAVEASFLVEHEVMSKAMYKKMQARRDIRVIRRGCRGTGALVAYDSMPERFRRKVEAIIRDPRKAAQLNEIETMIEHSASASAYFGGYTTDGERHLPAEKRREYYADAIVLDAVNNLINQRSGKRRALGHAASRMWDTIAEEVQDIDRSKYPHDLPSNPRSLERKMKSYLKDGYETLIHKNYLGKSNATKIDTEDKEMILGTLASDPRNLDNEKVARLYNAVAEAKGWKPITGYTVAGWRKKNDTLIYARRRGAHNFMNNKTMQVKRRAPEHPLSLFVVDGWDVELMYQDVNDKGVTTYTNRLCAVIVIDACCKYPVGYAIGKHESSSLIKEAMRDSLRHTEELFGQMMRPSQIQTDNYARTALTPVYQSMCEHYTPASVGNAKAKIIERWFKYFNTKYCQMQVNWSGFGVTSRKESQPNGDFLSSQKKSFPDFDGVREQIRAFISAERAELRDTYVGKYKAMPADRRCPMPYDQYLLTFGMATSRPALLQGSGLNVTINGVKRTYDCFDPSFRRHSSEKWTVRYDPVDTSSAIAVNADETLRYQIEEKYVQPMALADRTEGDGEQLARVRQYNDVLRTQIAGEISQYTRRAADVVRELRNDTLNKFLITDSRGQHKDEREKERLLTESKARLMSPADKMKEDLFDPQELLNEF